METKDDKITITVEREYIEALIYPQLSTPKHWSDAVDVVEAAIAEAEAKFQCKRCLKITSMSEQCYDESADIIVCSACSRELTRLDEGPGCYIAHKEAEEGKL